MVYYRKYRPQLISELDLEVVREKLTSILSSNAIPHAFLFTGSKGLGKTSSARILAKAINCEKRRASGESSVSKVSKAKTVSSQAPDTHETRVILDTHNVEPCNVCSACISITNGSAVDVLEIDAASNRGIDEIRDLRERIKFSPSSLKKKIYIIDEVHMLTTEAFNALLKTLEEPPEHVMFILATTETGKLPETIMSRVFQVMFEKPTVSELARSLSRVANGENLDLEDGVLTKIAGLSDGAFRDGAKILEELSLHTKSNKITLELLETLYKSGSTEASVDDLIKTTLKKDAKGSLEIINTLVSNNSDFKQVIEKMASKLHAILLEQALKSKAEMGDTKKVLELLDEAYKGLRGAVLPQLPLEIAVIEYCSEGEGERVKGTEAINMEVKKSPPSTVIARSETTKQSQPASPSLGGPASKSVTASDNDKIAAGSTPRNDNSSLDLFRKLLDLVNAENKILAGLLRGSRLEVVGQVVTIHPQSAFHMQKLSEKQHADVISKNLQTVMGSEIKLEFAS